MKINSRCEPGRQVPGDVAERIRELKIRIQELSGDPVVFGVSGGCPPEIEEAFLRHLLAFEEAPLLPVVEMLRRDGVTVAAPGDLADDELPERLWEVIRALAARRMYLECTDHLDDRALYELLWRDYLHLEERDLEGVEETFRVIDMTGSGSVEEHDAYLRYYASEEYREDWRREWPDLPLPEREEPPHDRDRFLPRPG